MEPLDISRLVHPQAAHIALVKQQAEQLAKTAKSRKERNAAREIAQRAAKQLELLALQPRIWIIGGAQAEPNQFPYQVALLINMNGYQSPRDAQYCGGTIVGSNWVLTAAHCVCPNPKRTAQTVFIGSTKLSSSDGHIVAIETISCHEQFDPRSLVNDIALLKLAGRGKVTDVRPVDFADAIVEENILAHTNEATVTGWGRTESAGRSDDLLFGSVPIVDRSICNSAISYGGGVTAEMMCAGDAAHDTCYGDSGGPLLMESSDQRMYQIGITSWGGDATARTCADISKPGVYTRVAPYNKWIRDHMK
jgi:secreted trypsin-like serine protease